MRSLASILAVSLLLIFGLLLVIDSWAVAQSILEPPPDLNRSLALGRRGDDVRTLQKYLAQDPEIYPEGLATGFFGRLTEKAVRNFQTKYGIDPVGVVGPITRAKLRELRTAAAIEASREIVEPIELGMSSPPPPADEPPPALPPPPPPPNPRELIKTGTGVVRDSQYLKIAGAEFLYAAGYGQKNRGYIYPAGTEPASIANVSAAGYSPCEDIRIGGYTGITNICEFTNAGNYAFTQHTDFVRLYDQDASIVSTALNIVIPCYQGILLWKHNNIYGALDPINVNDDGSLNYRYWYDQSGGTNFGALCSSSGN